jgi:acyl-CoA synthetase (AMP-forming)/AMP-acid ligase II
MLGYWNDEAATREAIDAAGWMHSGDLAVMDDDGYVRIVGRIKDLIIRGGENIHPREIRRMPSRAAGGKPGTGHRCPVQEVRRASNGRG